MSAPENPAAFPFTPNNTFIEPTRGMTLRDWFAGQALVALAAYGPKGHAPEHTVAGAAYEYADAMLAERAKGGAA